MTCFCDSFQVLLDDLVWSRFGFRGASVVEEVGLYGSKAIEFGWEMDLGDAWVRCVCGELPFHRTVDVPCSIQESDIFLVEKECEERESDAPSWIKAPPNTPSSPVSSAGSQIELI